jgi:hypothetical protein
MSERKDSDLKTSRRGFLGAAASARAALTAPVGQNAVAAPYRARVISPSSAGGRVGVAMPAHADMDSGAPLGGIGTGLLEIRPDVRFHEWQIFNSGAWAGRAGTAISGPPVSQVPVADGEIGRSGADLRRLYIRPEESNLYPQPYLQDIESIEYDAWFPMTGLR